MAYRKLVPSQKVGTTDRAMVAAMGRGCAILEVPLLVALEVRVWKDFSTN